jgi:Arm DNA-binding domain
MANETKYKNKNLQSMRIPIKALCEEKRTRRDGTALIYLQYFHDGEHRVFLNTKLAIPPEYWNKRRQCVKEALPTSGGDPATLNKEIYRQLRLASDLIIYTKEQGIVEKGDFVKETFSPTLDLEELIRQRNQTEHLYVPGGQKKMEVFFLQMDRYLKSLTPEKAAQMLKKLLMRRGNMRAFQNLLAREFKVQNTPATTSIHPRSH